MALLNASGQLGNYGLFFKPGDMAFVNAKLVTALQKKNVISFEDIKRDSAAKNAEYLGVAGISDEEIYYIHRYGWLFHGPPKLPILGQCSVALNIYEFIRNWTLFNIGEVVAVDGRITNGLVASLANTLMWKAGFGEMFEWTTSNDWAEWSGDEIGEHGVAVMVAHYEIGD
jgi:hypothetical protein